MKQYTYPLCVFSLLAITSATAFSASRTVGPEPGMGFSPTPSGVSMCEYGDYIRTPLSAFGGSCPNFIKAVDTELMQGTSSTQSIYLLPYSIVKEYNVKLNYDGSSGHPAVTPLNQYGVNIADPLFQQYLFRSFMDEMLASHGPNYKNGIPVDASHPTYISIDGYSNNYSYYGVMSGGWHGNVTWEAGFPSSEAEWYKGWEAFYNYAKNYAPQIRLSPHIGALENWSAFKSIYANCPAMLREWFKISQLHSYSASQRGNFYNELINLNWFANQAPRVFSNDPPTRVMQWGTQLDNGDIQSALAIYLLARGPNTFFDLVGSSTAINPSLWLPIMNEVGSASGSGPIQVLRTASGRSASSGYNLLQRTYSNGVAYFNFTGSTQTITLRSGSHVTLADGKGYVAIGR